MESVIPMAKQINKQGTLCYQAIAEDQSTEGHQLAILAGAINGPFQGCSSLSPQWGQVPIIGGCLIWWVRLAEHKHQTSKGMLTELQCPCLLLIELPWPMKS